MEISKQHVTKAEMARRHIQAMILSGTVGPGDRITTRGVSVDLGISETPIREALRSLASDGWLEIQNHVGAVVQGLQADQIREISALRGLVSGLAIELGADEFDEERLRRIDDNIQQYDRALENRDYPRIAEINYEFHQLLTENTKSPWCCRLLGNMHGLMSAQRHGIPPQKMRLSAALEEHRSIRDMLRKGEFSVAAELVKRHEKNTGDFLIKMINELPAGGRRANNDSAELTEALPATGKGEH